MSERPRADGHVQPGRIRGTAEVGRAGVPLQYMRCELAALPRRHCQNSQAIVEEFGLGSDAVAEGPVLLRALTEIDEHIFRPDAATRLAQPGRPVFYYQNVRCLKPASICAQRSLSLSGFHWARFGDRTAFRSFRKGPAAL